MLVHNITSQSLGEKNIGNIHGTKSNSSFLESLDFTPGGINRVLFNLKTRPSCLIVAKKNLFRSGY
jgi:hypothetical protein